MTLAAYALVTLAEAKARLRVVDADRDEQIETLINEVSRAILRATDREYAPATDGETRRVSHRPGTVYVDLWPYEARSVTDVVIAPDAAEETTLVATDYQLEPITSRDGIYDRLKLAYSVTTWSAFGSVPVDVTGDWGWAEVPDDVKGWTLEMVEDRWKQDFAAYSDGDGFVVEAPTDAGGPVTVPYRIRDEMDAARRIRIGSV